MDIESEIDVSFSPGARVFVTPWLPVAALMLGVVIGVAIAAAIHGRRPWRRRRRREEWPGGPQLRLPGESPDVETEL